MPAEASFAALPPPPPPGPPSVPTGSMSWPLTRPGMSEASATTAVVVPWEAAGPSPA